ncbi:MAG: RNA polymerase-associated protein RapA [Candidatus Heimdallarchaeota archaeon LC_2]|nr:MAG: RNA polymerase-associated protein RapA [Candidatus Heimdallarchaeota archaeon LC_2]
MENGKLRNDERVIIFTEYKDTQTYVQKVLDEKFNLMAPEVQILHGTTNQSARNLLKQEFNDKSSKIRMLIATDTASEGLNLQLACRYIIHYDIPWNPSKLEQRNGRVDRHGQAREVHIFHFNSENSADMKLLAKVASKVNTIQDDLGQVGEVLAQVVHRHFTDTSIYDWSIDDLENVDLTQTSDAEEKHKQIKRNLWKMAN